MNIVIKRILICHEIHKIQLSPSKENKRMMNRENGPQPLTTSEKYEAQANNVTYIQHMKIAYNAK
jgi:hypothetical protein